MIQRALARDVTLALALALGGATALLTLLQAVRLAPLAAAARIGGEEWLVGLGLSCILALEAVAPCAFAAAIVLTALRWHSSGELLGARAAGLGSVRLWSGALRVAVVASIGLAGLSLFAAPRAMARLEGAFVQLVPRAFVGALRPGAVVELLPGVMVYAGARRGPDGLTDVALSSGDVVLAARAAEVRLARGPALVLDAEQGVVRDRSTELRFERLLLPIDLAAAVQGQLAALPRGPAARYGAWRRAAAPASFLLVAALLCALALERAHRPAALTVAAVVLVGGREVLIRAGESAQPLLGAPLAAGLPVLFLLPVTGLGMWALASRSL